MSQGIGEAVDTCFRTHVHFLFFENFLFRPTCSWRGGTGPDQILGRPRPLSFSPCPPPLPSVFAVSEGVGTTNLVFQASWLIPTAYIHIGTSHLCEMPLTRRCQLTSQRAGVGLAAISLQSSGGGFPHLHPGTPHRCACWLRLEPNFYPSPPLSFPPLLSSQQLSWDQ